MKSTYGKRACRTRRMHNLCVFVWDTDYAYAACTCEREGESEIDKQRAIKKLLSP